jgi:hypothetical protein
MQKFEVTSKHKHSHVFMVREQECESCKTVATHFYAIVATNKNFNNATRIKQCEACNVTSLAPIGEDAN